MTQISMLDYAVVVARQKTLIIRFVIISLAVAAILLFAILPRWYKSTAVVMPPKQQGLLNLSSMLSRASAPLRSLGFGPSNTDLAQFKTILASRRIMEATLDSFDLMSVYDIDIREKALLELEGNVEIEDGAEDVSLEISVYDTDSQRAANMANFFVSQLDAIFLELSIREARANREFLETRYRQNIADLEQAQNEYKEFQETYGAYSIPDQVKGAIEVAATLEAQITASEVELGILEKTTSPDNDLRKRKLLEVRQLRNQMKKLIEGSPDSKSISSVFPPFQKAPEIGVEYLNKYRELEIQTKILELIVPLYEQAKIEEQRNTPSLLVLDHAIPAYRPKKPKRLYIMVGVLIGSLILAIIVAFFRESLTSLKNDEKGDDAGKLAYIKAQLRLRDLLR